MLSWVIPVVRKRAGWKIACDVLGLMADDCIVQRIQPLHPKWHFLMALSEISESFESETDSDSISINSVFAMA